MSCSICQEQFDRSTHIPIVRKCGHSLCESCLVSPDAPRNRHNRPILECPLCRETNSFEKMTRNFQMIEVMESLSRMQLGQQSTNIVTDGDLSEIPGGRDDDDDNSAAQTNDEGEEVLKAEVLEDAELAHWGGLRRSVFLRNTSAFEYVHYGIVVPRAVRVTRWLTRSTIAPAEEKAVSITHYRQSNNCSIEVVYWVDHAHKRCKNHEYDRVLIVEFPPI